MFKDHFTMMEGDAGGFLGATIFCITKDGVANMGKLGADLVVAPCVKGDFHKGGMGICFADSIGKKGLFA